MIEKEPNLFDQLTDFLFKIFIPAFIAISIKIAAQIKKEKMTFLRIIMSYVVGIGCGYFIYPFVNTELKTPYVPIIVAIISISGEKISEFFIYKWRVDDFLGALLEAVKDMIVSLIKGKK